LTTLDDADYFTFTAAQSGTVTLSSSLSTSTGNVSVQLQHVGGASSSSGSLSFDVVGGQTYSVAISSPGELGTYSLAFDVIWSVTPPTAPGSVTATGSSTSQIDLTWSDADGETGYMVYQWTGSGSQMVASLGADATSYQVTGLSSGTHWFIVGAYNSAGSTFAPWTSGSTFVSPPTSPGTLSISTVSNTALDLSWSDSSGEAGYWVYRWGSSGSEFVTSLSAGTTSYRASGLAANQTHWFTVGAYNSAGSAFTAWGSGSTFVTPPTAPGTLNVSTVSSTELDLSWNDSTGETGYYVYRWGSSGSEFVTSLSAGTTSFRATGLASGQNYWFTVGAHNETGASFTPWASGVTLASSPAAIDPSLLDADSWKGFTTPIEAIQATQIESNTFVAAAQPVHDSPTITSDHLDAVDEAFAHRRSMSRGATLRFVESDTARRHHRSTRHLGDELFGEKEFDFHRLARLDLAQIAEIHVSSAI
ncbi:MAG: fibronectin type III domain-containing protein, partial [Planctomycetes bacterium]|nr:fibronectin type III domain-containing protein [Planctomycetota bacterium]